MGKNSTSMSVFPASSGGKYEGHMINGRFEGRGKFTFPNGNVFEGAFKDGQFHGRGVLYFPGKGQYEGKWEGGRCVKGVYKFADGLKYDETKWGYCTKDDRRFWTEINHGVKPAGKSQMTNADGSLEAVEQAEKEERADPTQ